jgi:hypothetical protein
MTERSYFHNGSLKGDAVLAPYSDQRFHTVMQALYNSDGAWVVPATDNSFEVTHTGGQVVGIALGTGIVKGVYCRGSDSITLEDNPSGSRIDTIVIRINWENKTAEFVAIKGTAAFAPTLPTLQQEEGVIWEQPIAHCYILAGFAGFGDESIYDVREFFVYYNNLFEAEIPQNTGNFMHNSEFYAGPGSAADAIAPAMWETVGTPTVSTIASNFEGVVPRIGRPLYVSLSSTDTLSTQKYVKRNFSVSITTKLAIQVIKGSVTISIDGGVTDKIIVYPTNEPLEIYIRDNFAVGVTSIDLHFSGNSSTNQFYLWQVTMACGLRGADFLPSYEYILYGSPVNVIPETSYGAITVTAQPERGDSNLVKLRYSNTGSAGVDSVYASVKPNMALDVATDIDAVRTEVGRLTASTVREDTGWVNALKDLDTLRVENSRSPGKIQLDVTGTKT